MNNTSNTNPMSNYVNVPFRVGSLVMGTFIILMNLLVLFLYIKKKNIITLSAANLTLLSFAFNDMLAGTSMFFYSIPYLMHNDEKTVMKHHNYELIAAFVLPQVCLLSSVSHLILISFDRLVAVAYPFKHRVYVTRNKGMLALSIVWIISTSLPLMEYLLNGKINLKIYTLVIFLCFVSIPLLVLLYMSVKTVAVIQISLSRTFRNGSKRGTKKVITLIFVMMISFILCSIPYVAIRLTYAFNKTAYLVIPESVKDTFFILRFLTSVTNPILFTLYKKDFLKAFKATASKHHFRRKIKRQEEEALF